MNYIYPAINWAQGMNVSAKHFISLENYLLERFLQVAAISSENHYGILPNNKEAAISMRMVKIGSKLRVSLHSYHGITPQGYLVHFEDTQESISHSIETDVETLPESFIILLYVDPFERITTGVPDKNEEPPRYPFVSPSLKINILPYIEELPHSPNSVIIGRLKRMNNDYIFDSNYIPPSLTMESHESLRKYIQDFSVRLNTIEDNAKKILKKIQSQSHKSSVGENISSFSREILHYLRTLYYSWKNNSLHFSPYEVTERLSVFASVILSCLDFLSMKEKEELLKYFHEWDGVTPSNFEEMLEEIIQMKYDHNQINRSMVILGSFLQLLDNLLANLSGLEFIGQHRESIVISERETKTNTFVNRWTTE